MKRADACSVNSGTCTLEPTSICKFWKLKDTSHRQLSSFCLKEGVGIWEYLAWDTDALTRSSVKDRKAFSRVLWFQELSLLH